LTRGRHLARILIAGGGPAALEAALALRGLLDPEDEVDVVAEGEEFVYRPLAVAEPFGREGPQRFPLTPLIEVCGARHRRDLLVEVDLDAREAGLASGASILYDALLVAVGARAVAALPEAITFWGAGGDPDFVHALEGLRHGGGEISFVVPHRVAWSLPLYEVALQTAAYLRDRARKRYRISIFTAEPEPVAIFGGPVSAEIAERIAEQRIELNASADVSKLGSTGRSVGQGSTTLVALPRLVGPCIGGLTDERGAFLATDDSGRVIGARAVYAAGDATDFPIKQGGIATEQADNAAQAIAADLGRRVTARPAAPILRARLYTDGEPMFMRRDLADPDRDHALLESRPLWWPGAKLYGRHLAPLLASLGRLTDHRSTSSSRPCA
jgi:sulfide:quinone oxidoreductase